MTKTIEKAARQSAEKAMRTSCDRQKTWGEIVKGYENLFLDGVKHIQSLPLVERLTEEEKERVRKIRDMYYNKWREHPNEATEAVYCAIKETLESIFGKDLFQDPLGK